jgi:hypothetical protein
MEESFDYELLEVLPDGISGIRMKQRHIIFAEGFGCMPILILNIYH